MAWKELFDIDPELSAEGKKVMRALQSRRVWPQKDFLGLMQGVVPGQIEAVKAELEELGYVAERTEHEFVESWPNSRLFAKHDDTDLETYNPGPMRNISDLVDFLTKTKQLPEGDILSRRNAYRFFDSVFAQLDTDETIQLALMGVLQGGDVEARSSVNTSKMCHAEQSSRPRNEFLHITTTSRLHVLKKAFLIQTCTIWKQISLRFTPPLKGQE